MRPDSQSTLRFKRVEVTVGMQQQVVALNAKSGQKHIDGAAWGDTRLAQRTVVLRRRKREGFAACGFDPNALQQLSRFSVITLMPKPAQYLKQHQIGHHQGHVSATQQTGQFVRGRVHRAMEKADPDTGVSDDHGVALTACQPLGRRAARSSMGQLQARALHQPRLRRPSAVCPATSISLGKPPAAPPTSSPPRRPLSWSCTRRLSLPRPSNHPEYQYWCA